MNRRSLLLSVPAIAMLPSALRAEPPWTARLLKGGFDGSHYRMGLHLTMADHWKTYWRVPGSGGVAPQIDLKSANLKSHVISHPLPVRFEDNETEAIGYDREVVFPIAAEPHDATKALDITVDAFFGICEVVCIPAKFDGGLTFSPLIADAPDQGLLNEWQRRVPKLVVGTPILAAKIEQQAEKINLLLETSGALHDVFVEGSPQHYFGKPHLMRGLAVIAVHGAKDVAEIRGLTLRFTLDDGGQGLEQFVTVV